MFKTFKYASILALGLTCAGASAFAQGTSVAFGNLEHDSSLPVEIGSDQLNIDQADGRAVFLGAVDITQGDLTLKADRVEVIYNAENTSEIDKLVASGGVVVTNGTEVVEAQNAQYSLQNGTLLLSGSVILTRGGTILSGEKMTIDLNRGTGQIDGRVKTVLQPGSN